MRALLAKSMYSETGHSSSPLGRGPPPPVPSLEAMHRYRPTPPPPLPQPQLSPNIWPGSSSRKHQPVYPHAVRPTLPSSSHQPPTVAGLNLRAEKIEVEWGSSPLAMVSQQVMLSQQGPAQGKDEDEEEDDHSGKPLQETEHRDLGNLRLGGWWIMEHGHGEGGGHHQGPDSPAPPSAPPSAPELVTPPSITISSSPLPLSGLSAVAAGSQAGRGEDEEVGSDGMESEGLAPTEQDDTENDESAPTELDDTENDESADNTAGWYQTTLPASLPNPLPI